MGLPGPPKVMRSVGATSMPAPPVAEGPNGLPPQPGIGARMPPAASCLKGGFMNGSPDQLGPLQPRDHFSVGTWSTSRRRFLSSPASPSAVPCWAPAPPAVAPPRPATAREATARRRAGPAPPARRCSSPASSGARPTSFNPVAAPRPTGRRAGGQSQLIYESLLRFNLLDGSLSPGWPRSCSSRTTTPSCCRCRTAPSGPTARELTADDVVFTFELGQETAWSVLHDLELHRLGRRPPIRVPSSSS